MSRYDIDIRSLKWYIKKYPLIFPKFMREERYNIHFFVEHDDYLIYEI